MSKAVQEQVLRQEVVRAKDFHGRKFTDLVTNFYTIKAALRYYAVRKGMSITSTRISEDFPLPVTVAGSALSMLEELDVIEKRNESSSADRYPPGKVDLERVERIQEILVESMELDVFDPRED